MILGLDRLSIMDQQSVREKQTSETERPVA